MPRDRVRRAPLGFGTTQIYDVPVTMRAQVPRPFIPERLLVTGPAEVVAFRVDGVPYSIEFDFGEVAENAAGQDVFVPSPCPMWRVVSPAAGTYFELELAPLMPEKPPHVPRVVRALFARAPKLRRLLALVSARMLDWATAGDRRNVSAGVKGVVVLAPQGPPPPASS